jgi:Fe-S-cluster containining protein
MLAAEEIGVIVKQVRSGAAKILADPGSLQTQPALGPPIGKLRALLARVVKPSARPARVSDSPQAWLYALMSRCFALSDDITVRMGTEVLACNKGCSWCCSLEVGVTAPEVFAITDYLRDTLSPEELQGLRARLTELSPRAREASPTARHRLRIRCPLLVDNRCSVYPVRPVACRGWNSTDARACEISYGSFYQKDVPFSVTMRDQIIAIREGLSLGAKDAGLQGDNLELISALHVALETHDVEARWLAGERVFG